MELHVPSMLGLLPQRSGVISYSQVHPTPEALNPESAALNFEPKPRSNPHKKYKAQAPTPSRWDGVRQQGLLQARFTNRV